MTAAKHTPGPWLVVDRTVYALNEENVNRFYCSVQDARTDVSELEANTRLIASAPDLLAALQAAIKEIEGLPRSLGYEFTDLPFMRAAIAKATGSAP